MNLQAPINSTGYGIAGFNIFLNLRKLLNGDISLFPIGPIDISCTKEQEFEINNSLERAKSYNKNEPSLRIYHQNSLAQHIGNNQKLALTFFELDTLQSDEVHHLSQLDHILVATHWAKSIVEKYVDPKKIPISVVPLGVDRGIFHNNHPPRLLYNDYTVFACVGKAEKRKSFDVLWQAFEKAFTPADNVILKLCCENPFIGEMGNRRWRDLFRSGRMAKNIILQPRLSTQEDLARFVMDTDCGVFVSRAEGWGLEALEFLSCGKEIIGTFYSGHTEFLSNENSRLIDIKRLEPATDPPFFNGQGNWGAFGSGELDQLVEHMRAIHKVKQSGQLAGNVAGIETAKKFSWANSARKILEVVHAE